MAVAPLAEGSLPATPKQGADSWAEGGQPVHRSKRRLQPEFGKLRQIKKLVL
jgi:hypothetical protein